LGSGSPWLDAFASMMSRTTGFEPALSAVVLSFMVLVGITPPEAA
jgi:hypothetical protein